MIARRDVKTVLVVDDSKLLLRTYELLLKRYPTFTIDLHLTLSGFEGLERFRELQSVDLVLLDSDMPGMTGIEFLQTVKAEPTLRDTPVIVVSGEDSRSDAKRALTAGAARYLVKPIDERKLHEAIDETLAP